VTRKIIICPACNARFDVAKYPRGSKVRCGRCSQVLTVPPETVPVVAEAAPAPPPPIGKGRPVAAPSSRRADSASSASLSARAEPAPVATSLATPAAEGRDPLLGRVINGQFRVVRKLGEGGYGAVYEAKDVNLERRIALKIMLPTRAASREYVAKFFREARTAAQLSHPNVVAVHSVGLDDECKVYFLAMEYVEGRTLHDVLQERGPLPVAEASEYIIQSCRGLAAAHERNIIHRDIKPGNLMITPGGAIKIADFGLAKVYEGEGGAQSTVIGTPYFMPPEQFEGRAKDGRTDIYALGVTFYYMLTMQRAHTGAGPAQILLSVMTKEPTSVLEHRPDLPEGIWPIVRRMIDRDLDNRYQNCIEIVRDLEQLLGGGDEEVEQIYCGACGVPNPTDATECSGCKESLLEKCPVCGGEDAAGTKFCGNCGANIPAERAVLVLVDEARQFLSVGRLARAKEKIQQAQDRSPENLAAAELFKEFEGKRELRDAHRDAIRELLARGRVADAADRLASASAQFPESVEIAEVAKDVEAAQASPDTTGSVSGVAGAVAEARRLEDDGRVREALVAWRGVRLLLPNDEGARAGEARTAERVEKAERLFSEGAELLRVGDPETALQRFEEANSVLPGDALVEGRIKEAGRLAQDVNAELAAIEADVAQGRGATAPARLRALADRYPRARDVAEALARVESAGHEARRDAARDRLAKALAAANTHENAKRLRDAATAWREAAALDPDSADAQSGVARVERSLAEFEALLGQSRNLLASGDPEGGERAAAEALAIVAGDPAGEAQFARARTQVETLRHEAERIRTALASEPDDDVLNWARELAARCPGSALAADVLRETEAKCKEAEEKATEKKYAPRLDRAKKLESEGNLEQALKAYREVLKSAPDQAEAKAAAARIDERFARAREKADEAKRLLEAGDPDGARAAAEASIELRSDHRETAGILAGAKTALGEIERAAQALAATLPVDRAEQQLDRAKRLEAKYPKSARCVELTKKAADALDAAKRAALSSQVKSHVDAARAALASGKLTAATDACREALALDPSSASAKEALDVATFRIARAKTLADEGRAAAKAGRHSEARDKFSAALESDPALAEATEGRDAASEEIEKSAAELASAVERATSLTRSGSPVDAAAAWTRVAGLDPTNRRAQDELARLNARIEKASADVARGRALLDAGDPEAAVAPLDAARAALGPGDVDAALGAAKTGAADISKSVREIEAALSSTDGELDAVAKTAAELAAKYPGSGRARDVATHAASAAAERGRALAVTRVRRLVRERRYGEARDLAVSLRAEGVKSADLDAAAAQAEQAILKLDSLRARAAESRKTGRLLDAREALRELLVALPDDAAVKAECLEIDETIREVGARRDAAESARRRGALAQAIELYREALALQTADPEIVAEIERLSGAVKERAKNLDVCHDAVRRGDGKTCAENAKLLLESYPDDDDARDLHTTGECMEKIVTALLSRSERQIASGDKKGADETLECLLRVAPGHKRAKQLLRA
jgi:serine/threonine-protein kinase